MPRIALIHALAQSVAPINEALDRDWPECVRMNLLDDSLSADLARAGGVADGAMHRRFLDLGSYARSTGADAILFTCSAFGTCIEGVVENLRPLPVLKPNEAMVRDAVLSARRVGLLVTFEPTMRSMPRDFPDVADVRPRLVTGAMDALRRGEADLHDALIAQAARASCDEGCGVIALAQFSMARAAAVVRTTVDVPVLTTVDSAVRELRQRLAAALA